MVSKNGLILFISTMLVFTVIGETIGQEDGGDLRSAVQNPISSLISVPFKFSYDSGAENGDGYVLNIQPVVPVSVGEWNIATTVS